MGYDTTSYYRFSDPEREKLFKNRRDYSDIYTDNTEQNKITLLLREMLSGSGPVPYEGYGDGYGMQEAMDFLNRIYPDGEFRMTASNNTAEPDLTYIYSPANEQIAYRGYLDYDEAEEFYEPIHSDAWLEKLGLPKR